MAISVSVSESLRSVLNDFPNNLGKEDYSIVHLADDSREKFVKIPTDQIYKETMLSRLNFLSNYRVKSIEKRFRFQSEQHDLYLLTRDDIRRHKQKYDFLHIGLVQVYVTISDLLFERRFDHKILVCLRDAKHPNMRDSILASLEMSLLNGGTKFNWFPNFSSSLSDLSKSNGLVITMEPLAEDGSLIRFEISYRMCYKLMKGSLEPRSQLETPVLEVRTEQIGVLAPIKNDQKELN